MTQLFNITSTSRNIVAKILENHTLEQLNKIPEGFSNNLIWNIAHIIVTQQILVYRLSGLPMMVSDELVKKYSKGTQPTGDVSQKEVNEIKELLFSTIEKTEEDFKNEVFKDYQEYPTSTGFVLKSAFGAITFNNFHEGIHIGVMMAIKKLV